MASLATSAANDNLKGPLVWSLVFHTLIFSALVVSTLRSHRGELWGGSGGGAMTVGLVAGLPGVPLPRPDATTPSRVVDESRGLHRAEPKAPPKKQVETPAKQIPEFAKNQPQKYVSPRPSKVLEDPTPPPPGAIPYGEGGAPSLPYTQFTMGASTQGGMDFTGPGGAFGTRFPWYVEAVRRKISSNWLLSAVDPGVQWAPRVVVTFQVLRDGAIVNIETVRSSGNASVDRSAVRAVLASGPLDRLPNEYPGSHVMVEFWFDFKR